MLLPRTDTQTVRGDTAEPAEGSAKEDGHGPVEGFQCWPIEFNLCWRYFVCLFFLCDGGKSFNNVRSFKSDVVNVHEQFMNNMCAMFKNIS